MGLSRNKVAVSEGAAGSPPFYGEMGKKPIEPRSGLEEERLNRCLILKARVFKVIWGCSSAGRAPALQAGGHRFDPVHLHQRRERDEKHTSEHYGLIAQVVRAHA